MKDIAFSALIKCGKSRRKVEEISLEIRDIECRSDKNWFYHVICTGLINEDKVLEGNSAFDCVVLGMAFLRQALRRLEDGQPKLKFYEDVDGDLEELTIADIFWTHDCVTDEMEEMMEWAKNNGYKNS